ncbi:MAG: HpcH/HpaI aldolase/citrate lyase family protein, partial [Acidiferrobacterales bacterium]
MTILRSLLFVPGNRPNMLEKALSTKPDVFVPDLEDSVPPEEKVNARRITAAFLPKLSTTGRLVMPRVNSLETGLLEEDMAAVVGSYVFGISVGKIESAEEILTISEVLEQLEKKAGLASGKLKLMPWIETARAVVNVYAICLSSPRVIAVAFGAEDFTNDMGIERTEDDSEIDYPRNVVCIAAKAADVTALDTPYFKFRDPEGLQQDAVGAKRRGFRGKFAIHPAQIDIINETFSPSTEEIDHARRVVAAFEQAERQGRGSTSLNGKVIDVPVVKRARALLEIAEKTRYK